MGKVKELDEMTSEEIQNELSKIYKEEEMYEWQPIETAPRDGTKVLLLSQIGIFVGSYDTYDVWGRWALELSISGDGVDQECITHWMPLPKPPESEG